MRRSGLATTSGSAGTGPGNDTGVWLIMTIILFALLCNYSRTICLIDVGTEGSVAPECCAAAGKPAHSLHHPLRTDLCCCRIGRSNPCRGTSHRCKVARDRTSI